jgi:hypothetical protein
MGAMTNLFRSVRDPKRAGENSLSSEASSDEAIDESCICSGRDAGKGDRRQTIGHCRTFAMSIELRTLRPGIGGACADFILVSCAAFKIAPAAVAKLVEPTVCSTRLAV